MSELEALLKQGRLLWTAVFTKLVTDWASQASDRGKALDAIHDRLHSFTAIYSNCVAAADKQNREIDAHVVEMRQKSE